MDLRSHVFPLERKGHIVFGQEERFFEVFVLAGKNRNCADNHSQPEAEQAARNGLERCGIAAWQCNVPEADLRSTAPGNFPLKEARMRLLEQVSREEAAKADYIVAV